jgi:Major Facilitator Superfamily
MAAQSAPEVKALERLPGCVSRLATGFKPPPLPSVSGLAFRWHLAFTLFYAMFEGVIGNAPLMAVKALRASDVQLQLPLAMTSVGLFGSVLLGATMAKRPKKPFIVVPGFVCAIATMVMAWLTDAGWFLFMTGIISICDFAMRPGVPSIVRLVYPDHSRSRVAGTMRQYASIVFLGATLGSAALLSMATEASIRLTIQLEITLAGLACAAAIFCFRQLPDYGDGSAAEAVLAKDPPVDARWATLTPLRDKSFRRYLAAFFVFGFANLFHQGVVPAYFALDLGLGYVQATLLLHVIPNLTAFFTGGLLTSWFERTSVWRSYALVTLLWGLDPLILATASFVWPALIVARTLRGPATLGSMVIAFFTGVHSFARPGRDTSRYMAAQFLITGMARLLAPTVAVFALAYLSRRSIILCGGIGILASSLMFWWYDGNKLAVE